MLKSAAHTAVESLKHIKMLIVGGGSAGIIMSSKLCKIFKPTEIAVADNSDKHYYQPGWPLVAAKEIGFERTCKPMSSVIPNGVKYIKANAKTFLPLENAVLFDDGQKVNYDYLIIAIGINPYFDAVTGMQEALDSDPSVFTIYDKNYLKKSYGAISSFKGGNAIFTFPLTESIKCRGAAIKILNIADDIFLRNHVEAKKLFYITPKDYMFPVKKYNDSVTEIALSRGAEILYHTVVIGIDHTKKEVTCEKTDGSGKRFTLPYDMVHFTPDMKTPSVLHSSLVSDENGFVKVDKYTSQHVLYPNVFSIGDCSSLPTSKTLSAVYAEVDILYENIKAYIEKSSLKAKYNGYSSCPLITHIGKIVLAEFDYDKNPLETFPFDQGKESRFVYMLKKYAMLPYYWNIFLRGKGKSPVQLRKIFNPFGT